MEGQLTASAKCAFLVAADDDDDEIDTSSPDGIDNSVSILFLGCTPTTVAYVEE